MDKHEFPSFERREEVPERYRWDTTRLFENDEAFVCALSEAKDLEEEYEIWEPTAMSSGAGLLGYLRFDDDATLELERLFNYVSRRADEDTRVGKYQDLKAQLRALIARVGAASAWFVPRLLALSDETLDGWYADTPGLNLYRRAIDRMRALKDHVLTPSEEALLAQASEMAAQPEAIFSMLNDADMSFEDAVDSKGHSHAVTHGSYFPLMQSGDRSLRESAYHSIYGAYGRIKNTSAALLGSQTKQLQFFARARRYADTLEAALAPTEVPVSVYQGLIDAVHKNVSALHRYMELRRRVLGLDALRYWDLYVPLTKEDDRRYSFDEACDLMLRALAPLGEDYLGVVRRAIDERWYDVYETPGKASGAYSSGGRGLTPLILLNYQGTLDDIFTLVHETGHSLHTHLASEAQPGRYAQYEMFVAEVASTTNECLLLRYLLDNAQDTAERAHLLNHLCEQFRGTLFRQTLFAEFERDVNKASARGEGMGADALSERYAQLNELYYGSAVTLDDEIAHEWERIPHFYYNYYVYVYATSFAAAVALSKRILTGDATARDRYLAFLSGGSSKPPIELLAGAGVDMASGAVVDEALDTFSQTVDELEGLL
ncbi:oligopeptidase PepB [Olsenella sp. oral taxon 807]|uniref:oligoendopeptidase F n=1 Tax=Olsenella sp. oral taxon 807 TaxID=712411 RepID=UPI000679EB18|nr:oligoendopeptidase F [Olsenella sp. oral taxon 807]AKT49525.1 oligopeptidase PepB [Olsenella sp. oral taxon 807]